MKVIRGFQGDYRWLSNFHKQAFYKDGEFWTTAEHYYQAHKAIHRRDFTAIRLAKTPGEAKRMGAAVALREGWNDERLAVMLRALQGKFRDPELAKLLLGTGDAELIEENTWGDVWWGTCQGYGANKLGGLLMQVRQELKEKREAQDLNRRASDAGDTPVHIQ